MTKLKRLIISNNQLTELPKSIKSLIKLNKIELSSNLISHLQEELWELLELTSLSLADNKISTVPAEISHLSYLTSLDLSSNALTSLPEEIGLLSELTTVNLSGNKFTEIPGSFVKLNKLKQLDLGDNSDLSIPTQVVEDGIKAIFNFINLKDRSNEFDYLYEAKLVIVGRGFVGKSSLVKKLTIPSYSLEKEISSTEGIDIEKWDIEIDYNPGDKVKLNTYSFRLNIWDFGGQEKYDATHQLFITERTLYLFVTEARQESNFLDFDYWLNMINLLGKGSPVIVVQNKIDQRQKILPSSHYSSLFPNVLKFVDVSCADSYGQTIDNLKLWIQEAIKLLPQIGDELPKVWVDIRKELEILKNTKDYISYSEYVSICMKYRLDKEEANFLSSYLHNLGIIIHHKHDAGLKDLVIINPDWATDGIYAVLDNATLFKQRGRFTLSDLENIWKDERFNGRHRDLIDIMKKYEFCFELKRKDSSLTEYIAPELLPPNPLIHNLIGSDHLLFFYEYDFMPAGILSRLIVKAHDLIEKEYFWKYGVLLAFEDNTYAEVIENYTQRKIIVRLSGPNKKELFTIFRRYLSQIHKLFKNIAYKEMIPCICDDCRKSKNPFYFEYSKLKRRLSKGRKWVECEESLEDVEVQSLLDGIEQNTNFSLVRDFISKDRISDALELMRTIPAIQDEIVLVERRFTEIKSENFARTISNQVR